MKTFEKNDPNDIVTTEELAQILGGGDCFIRSSKGRVTGIAIRLDLNPEAPGRILVGKGPRLEKLSKKVVDANEFLPVYLKLATNQWSFLGRYKAERFATEPDTVEQYREGRSGELSGVLFLTGKTDTDEVDARVKSGHCPDAARRKRIEEAAVSYVITKLSNDENDYLIESVEKQNLGFDLLARAHDEIRRIEVKGTSAEYPAFFLTANEYQAARALPNWELIVVTEADTNPCMHYYSPEAMLDSFSMEPVAYRCVLNSKEWPR